MHKQLTSKVFFLYYMSKCNPMKPIQLFSQTTSMPAVEETNLNSGGYEKTWCISSIKKN